MPTISSTGLGSGVDINEIVKSLVAAEGDAKKALMDGKEAQALAKISGFGAIKSDLEALQTQMKTMDTLLEVQKYTATVQKDADGVEMYSAITSNAAKPGSYDIRVTNLAKAHRISSGNLTSATSVVGTGTLVLTSNGSSTSITIDSSNNTVEGIRDAINATTTDSGIVATILSVNSGVILSLSSVETGTDYSITTTVPVDGDDDETDNFGLSRLASAHSVGGPSTGYMTTNQAAQDATLTINGLPATRQSNIVTDLIDGVILTLKKVDVVNSYTLSIAQDAAATKKLITDFVTKYNALVDTIQGLTKYVTNQSKDNQTGALIGDSTVRSLLYNLRKAVNYIDSDGTASYRSLSDIGVKTLTKTGKLEINETTLDAALRDKLDEVSNIFSKNGTALSNEVENTVNLVITRGGSLANTIDKLNKDIAEIKLDRVKLQESLNKLESRLFEQFNAMDRLVAQIKSTSDFLSQQLDNFVKPLSFTKK